MVANTVVHHVKDRAARSNSIATAGMTHAAVTFKEIYRFRQDFQDCRIEKMHHVNLANLEILSY